MKLYVFESDKWLESDVIYPHDIAVCLQQDMKKIYVWEGPRATPATKKKAQEALNTVKQKFSHYSVEVMDTNTPRTIFQFIEQYITTRFEEVETIDRDPQFVVFYYLLLGLFGALGYVYFQILRIIGWQRLTGVPWVMISQEGFASWVQHASIALLIVVCIFAVSLLFAGFTKKLFLISTASVAIVVLVGSLLYFRLGIYLFDFKPGAPLDYYYISIGEIVGFFFLNIIALGVIIIPMIISVVAIQRTTTPISWNQWREKRKKKVIEMKKFSILDVISEFKEVEHESQDEQPSKIDSHPES